VSTSSLRKYREQNRSVKVVLICLFCFDLPFFVYGVPFLQKGNEKIIFFLTRSRRCGAKIGEENDQRDPVADDEMF